MMVTRTRYVQTDKCGEQTAPKHNTFADTVGGKAIIRIYSVILSKPRLFLICWLTADSCRAVMAHTTPRGHVVLLSLLMGLAKVTHISMSTLWHFHANIRHHATFAHLSNITRKTYPDNSECTDIKVLFWSNAERWKPSESRTSHNMWNSWQETHLQCHCRNQQWRHPMVLGSSARDFADFHNRLTW